MLRTYLEVVSYFIEVYFTYDVIAETEATLKRYMELPTLLPTQYARPFETK